MRFKSTLLATLAVSVFAVAGGHAATIVFSEDFGALANATTITTSNTNAVSGLEPGSFHGHNPESKF